MATDDKEVLEKYAYKKWGYFGGLVGKVVENTEFKNPDIYSLEFNFPLGKKFYTVFVGDLIFVEWNKEILEWDEI